MDFGYEEYSLSMKGIPKDANQENVKTNGLICNCGVVRGQL